MMFDPAPFQQPSGSDGMWAVIDTPIDRLLLLSDGEALTGVRMEPFVFPPSDWRREDVPVLADAARQLAEYFNGEREVFDVPLAPRGTTWQRRVWAGLLGIRYGETTSYGTLAAEIGAPGRARAVGAANGANPIAVVVPCHRVIGADGTLIGYGGGLERKDLLLRLERGQASLPLAAG